MTAFDLSGLLTQLPRGVRDGVLLALALGVALALQWGVVRVLRPLLVRGREAADARVGARIAGPIRWILVVIALGSWARGVGLSTQVLERWRLIEGLVTPALLGWMVIGGLLAVKEAVERRADIAVADNLEARRRRTRVGILTRVGVVTTLLVTLGMMLLSIPSVRSVGVTLMASAGLAGLAVGAAAQPALKNLIAGIQLAFTEPIRIDDVVIVSGEWGWVEEIHLTYVVVKVWDERRLVVPVSRFLDEPFQNWTRREAQLLGSVFLYLDPTADVKRLRDYLASIIHHEPLWDRRAWVLQVTDTRPDAIEVRVLITAKDSPTAFDLRCAVREKLLAFVRTEMPHAFPRRRTLLLDDEPAAARGIRPDRTAEPPASAARKRRTL